MFLLLFKNAPKIVSVKYNLSFFDGIIMFCTLFDQESNPDPNPNKNLFGLCVCVGGPLI